MIHEALERNAETANEFLRALQADATERRSRPTPMPAKNERLVAMLARHLDDEEDLIIPLILDRGDRGLGWLAPFPAALHLSPRYETAR